MSGFYDRLRWLEVPLLRNRWCTKCEMETPLPNKFFHSKNLTSVTWLYQFSTIIGWSYIILKFQSKRTHVGLHFNAQKNIFFAHYFHHCGHMITLTLHFKNSCIIIIITFQEWDWIPVCLHIAVLLIIVPNIFCSHGFWFHMCI